MQQWRWVVIGIVATVVASIAGAGALVAATGTSAGDVGSHGRRRLGDSGISVSVPDGWVDHRRTPRAPTLLLEAEHRPIAGVPLATRGMWVGRWQAADPTTELARMQAEPGGGWSAGPRVAGLESVVREEVIGPTVAQRLPAMVTLHRRELRVVGFGSVFQIGFWGPQPTLGDDVERAVLAHVTIEAPPPIALVQDGVSLTMPDGWFRGHCEDSVCAFSPLVDGQPNASWVYLFPWRADSLDAGEQRLLDSLGRQETVADIVHEPVDIGGSPAIRTRFAMAPKDTGPAEVEELLVRSRKGFVLIALGWRTPEGRAQLDSVMSTLRL